MNYFKIIINGIVKENPTFVLLLGMCPTLGTTSSALNGMMIYIVVIASLVTILQMCIKAYAPEIDKSLGLFIPLIVVNCIILGRAESFAAKNNPVASIFDGIGIGLGFTLGLTILGSVREILGTGCIFGTSLYSEDYGMLLFVLAPGAFLALGYLIAIFNKIKAN